MVDIKTNLLQVGSMAAWANGNYDGHSNHGYDNGYSGQGEDAAAKTTQCQVCS